jgi:hypothetical protein
MTMHASADLLSDFKFWAMRPDTDESLTDAQIYRLLTLAQQQVSSDVATLFPRFLMNAPVLMTTSDGGITYTISGTGEDGETVAPLGHAEVYATSAGYELYGSTYGGGGGDVVFEGTKIRMPQGRTGTYGSGPYIRYVSTPGTLNASTQPTLHPLVRPLLVPQALKLWAMRGGQRDPAPYVSLYDQVWRGPSGLGGLLGALSTQYLRSMDAALEGVQWWRWFMTQPARVD